MTQTKGRRKIVKAQSKGQVTIPNEFREALGIEAETLLSIYLVGDHLEITPLGYEDSLRRYTDEDIARFLEEDKIDPELAKKVDEMLAKGEL
ncbi:MAG: AbrB/MazE/SpoVT family DNA-binding domain-containing protein [SAR202 cluster bacterium]|nr:AbrB/MazE/SpoVT family DNA-binding domain-containing protein [SAR202 cluster bacterium]